jgi:uncharacterized protein
MPTVLITGGTGLIGRAITKTLLQRDYNVVILTRGGKKMVSTHPKLRYANWDVDKQQIDQTAISEADHIIHLAGAGVADKRWTKKRKQEIVNSRVLGSKLIVDSLAKIPNKVKTVLSTSAIGWYGPDLLPSPRSGEGQGMREEFSGEGKGMRTETDPPASDFLGETCRKWEESIQPVRQLGKRLVILRVGIVLTKEGGALKEFLKPLRFGVATILGSGKQIVSWIHIDDLVSMYIASMENENLNGIYNAVGPAPVSNKELILSLARERKRFFIPVRIPSFVLKIVLGELSIEVLKSAAVSADKIQQTGFRFQYPHLKDALAAETR